MSKPQKPQKLKGFQDIHDQVMLIKNYLSKKIEQKSKAANFVTIDTPCLEYTETLLGLGGETDKQVFRFTDNGGRDVALRYDLTVPFARFVAEHHGKLPLPYKRFQTGKVWRAEKPQKGRYREFSQCDFDIIGINNEWADIEILSIFYAIFSQVIKLPFTMSIGDRQVVSAVIHKIYGKIEDQTEQRILINLDKLAKIGPEKVCDLIVEETKTSREQASSLLNLIISSDSYSKQIDSLRDFLKDDTSAQNQLTRLHKTFEVLSLITDNSNGTLKFDLSIVRGLAYYTGIVFETILDDFQDYGSVGSGGRYDDLSGRFMKESLSGIGGSVGLDRIVAALSSQKDSLPLDSDQVVMLAIANEEVRDYGFEILKTLRENNICSEIYLKEQKLANQFKFASKMKYSYVITVGDEEKNKRTFNLKNMNLQKESKNISFDSLINEIRKNS